MVINPISDWFPEGQKWFHDLYAANAPGNWSLARPDIIGAYQQASTHVTSTANAVGNASAPAATSTLSYLGDVYNQTNTIWHGLGPVAAGLHVFGVLALGYMAFSTTRWIFDRLRGRPRTMYPAGTEITRRRFPRAMLNSAGFGIAAGLAKWVWNPALWVIPAIVLTYKAWQGIRYLDRTHAMGPAERVLRYPPPDPQ
jgi:hypothetical protein